MTTPRDPSTYLAPPCTECKAKCCRYVAVEIDSPTCKQGYDTVRWYLLHKNVQVYVDHGKDWFVEFATDCEVLQPDFMCGDYEARPQICREHGWPVGSCEFFEDPCRHYFKGVKDFEAYLENKGIDWRWKRRPKTEEG